MSTETVAGDYPIRKKSAQGRPRPLYSITRGCAACGACFLQLAAGKTGERGLWKDWRWYCSLECAQADLVARIEAKGKP